MIEYKDFKYAAEYLICHGIEQRIREDNVSCSWVSPPNGDALLQGYLRIRITQEVEYQGGRGGGGCGGEGGEKTPPPSIAYRTGVSEDTGVVVDMDMDGAGGVDGAGGEDDDSEDDPGGAKKGDVDVKSSVRTDVIEYHVCYHPIYREPVLYVMGYDEYGQLLPLEDTINGNRRRRRSGYKHGGQKMPVVTQESHPVLHMPCYMLHPCTTGNILSSLMAPAENNHGGESMQERHVQYVLGWLSVVAMECGLSVAAAWVNTDTK